MNTMTAAAAMVKALEREGVSCIFGYPGAAIAPFYDALAQSSIRHILVRNEQNAGHAASGYARAGGCVGVCAATSGPGALNLITAIASAYMDSIPIVAITGQVRSDLLGRDVFQEADITGAAEPFTKYSYLVKKAEDLPYIISEAFYIAKSGRPGPVLIDVPVDVQNTVIEDRLPPPVSIRSYKPNLRGHANQIKKAVEALEAAEKPVVCAGGGVISSGAKAELITLCETLNLPAVSTMMGIGIFPSDHPLYLGMLGSHGKKEANLAVHGADLVLIVGGRVGDRAVAAPDQLSQKAKIIHIDIDAAEIGKNMPVSIPIVGDAKLILQEMLAAARPSARACWLSRGPEPSLPEEKSGFVEPRRFLRLLSSRCDEDCIVVADVGQNQIWSANYFTVHKGCFFTSGGMGTMGYSVPAAIGASLAAGRQVIAVCGDGSFQMMLNELATIAQNGISVKIVVMRNCRLGMVREIQTKSYGNRLSGVLLDPVPDIGLLCKAYGIPAIKLTNMDGAEAMIDQFLSRDGTCVAECLIDPEENSV